MSDGSLCLSQICSLYHDLGGHCSWGYAYRWTAEDREGNTATTGTVSVTVINGAPEVPSGTITVAADDGSYPWTLSTDLV